MGWIMDGLREAVRMNSGGVSSGRSSFQGLPLDAILEERLGVEIGNALACVEVCSNLWQSAFEHAKVMVDGVSLYDEQDVGLFRYGVTARMLGQIGRAMVRTGEMVYLVEESMSGLYPQVYFIVAQNYQVYGMADPRFWSYDLVVNSPNGSAEEAAMSGDAFRRQSYPGTPASKVVHFMHTSLDETPWIGVGPLLGSKTTFDMLKVLEAMLRAEVDASSGYVVVVPSRDDVELEGSQMSGTQSLKETYLSATRRFMFSEDGNAGMGDGGMNQEFWRQVRLGFLMEESNRAFRNDLQRDVYAACGVPESLIASGRDSSAIREGMRQFTDMTIGPKLRVVAEELSQKMMRNVSIVPNLAHDAASIARAFSALTNRESGMAPEDALEILGLGP